MNHILAAARAAFKAGLCVVPPREDGSKAPIAAWKEYQTRRPTIDEMRIWFADGTRYGLGALTGTISRELELFEFDDGDTYITFRDNAESIGLGDLVERIEAGYLERTPGGGVHWLYRCSEVRGNTKLARRLKLPDEKKGDRDTVKTLIETKGEGGYVVLAPSSGPVHESGGAYTLERGGFDKISVITPEERDALWTLARVFDQMPKSEYRPMDSEPEDIGGRPGDEYNANGPDWRHILEGWQLVYRQGQKELWRRPGKDHGISATINGPGVGPDRLYVFTSSTPFEPDRSYTKFQAYAILEHGGDFVAAARHLKNEGYGKEDRTAFVYSNGVEKPEVTAAKPAYPQTDTGNAERLVTMFGENIRYVFAWDRWLVWDGKRWAPDETRQLERMAKAVARTIHDEAREIEDEKEQKAAWAWARKSESTAGKRSMIVSAEAEPGVIVPHDTWDADLYLLNTESGTIDLRSGTETPHRQQNYMSKIAGTGMDMDATAPRFHAFMHTIFNGNRELIDFVQRAVGYSLTGATVEQVMFILYGTGANGKSTFLDLMLDLAHEYGRQTPTETLLVKRTESIPNDLAALRGARFVAAFESDESRRMSEALIKQMTGGDRISARFMRGEWFEFKPQFKLWLATNHKPEVRGTDHAIWRRIKLIPFDVTIPEHQRDPDLPQKLRAELPAILAWAVEGARLWNEQGLGDPEAVRMATSEYRSEMDVLGRWLEQRCVIDANEQTSASSLYADYVDWAKDTREEPVNTMRFGLQLEERGFRKKKNWRGTIDRVGLRLRGDTTFELKGDG